MSTVEFIGYMVAAAAGLAVAAGLLYVAARLTAKYGYHTWKNVAGIYRMEVMKYWFRRMEAEGTHILRKAYEDKRAEMDQP